MLKLKSRLLTAFLIITALPVILLTIVSGTIVTYQLNNIQKTYDVHSGTLQVISNPLQIFSRITRGVYNEIIITALNEPEKFSDMEYIEYLNGELKSKFSFIALRKGDEFIFTGDPDKLEAVQNLLPEFGLYNTDLEGGIYIEGSYPFLLKQQDFYFEDGTEGSIFVITDAETIVPQIKYSVILIIIAFILIIILSAAVLIIWIYRSILRPINILHIATDAMKEGNLDYSIEGDPEDEIGLLCIDFEEMRIRLKELIEVRLKYEKDTKELISNITHDLKTPLTAIKGYAEGIMDGVADTDEKRDKYLKTIYNKANDMSVLVDELSFYSKIDCNTIPYTFKVINLYDYFDDCINEIRLELEMKNIELSYTSSTENCLCVQADAEQLKRVVNNIISNAVKYIGNKKGHIQIQVSEGKEFAEIAFRDNGVGISAKDLPHIFERFYRADVSRNSKGGSGIGLAIAKKIIEDHMGNIWAESEVGKGTTIHFTLRKCREELSNE
ncbi:MAG: hypothetical protein K0R92_567 [Lachnospiraceae bacterium]|jgi:signal transduction histidine kinase|nr:hypothetical protein [Lachnospiraceae bacterium]